MKIPVKVLRGSEPFTGHLSTRGVYTAPGKIATALEKITRSPKVKKEYKEYKYAHETHLKSFDEVLS